MPLFVAWFGCLVNRFENTARPAAAAKCRAGWESGVESQSAIVKLPSPSGSEMGLTVSSGWRVVQGTVCWVQAGCLLPHHACSGCVFGPCTYTCRCSLLSIPLISVAVFQSIQMTGFTVICTKQVAGVCSVTLSSHCLDSTPPHSGWS